MTKDDFDVKRLLLFWWIEFEHVMNVRDEMTKRTTVSFEDEHYAVLERWADKEVRTVGNLIQAIVVSVLRGDPFEVPEALKEPDEEK